jgi:hypothetical protein
MNNNFVFLPKKSKNEKVHSISKTSLKQNILANIADIKQAKFPILYKKIDEKDINIFTKKSFIFINLDKNGFTNSATLELFKINNTIIVSKINLIKLFFVNVFLLLKDFGK